MALPAHKLSLADFLSWENDQPARHEFCRGEIFAKVGARRVHGLVVGNLFAAFKLHLKGNPCRAFVEGMKVQVGDDAIFYPDVFVTCDAQDLTTERVFRQPKLLVEVLSATTQATQAYDRGLKLAAYRRIETLQEYVLLDPDTRSSEVFRRNERGLFELHDQTGGPELHLASVGLRLAMVDVFDGVEGADEAPG